MKVVDQFNTPGRFTGYQRVLNAQENKNGLLTVTIQHPTARYFNQLLNLKCTPDLLSANVFPNAKEVTEAFGIYNAAKRNIPLELSDPNVIAIVVGDGSTPRCGAVFAFRTQWSVISIDPQLSTFKVNHGIKRLQCIADKIENLKSFKAITYNKVLIIMPHSHANMDTTLNMIKGKTRHLICSPCCQSLIPSRYPLPDISYDDWGIWSPERNIQIWLNI